jgi:drug/metabolite transporter (DMT)-like permease
MQTMAMFIAEISIGAIFYFKKRYNPSLLLQRKYQEAQRKGRISDKQYFYLSIPATCDFCATLMQFFSLLFIAPSVWQMLRGGTVVIIAVASVMFLNRKLFRHHILGLILVVGGITLVGVSAIVNQGSDGPEADPAEQLLGICIMVLSLFLQAGIFLSEEMIMNKFYFEPA